MSLTETVSYGRLAHAAGSPGCAAGKPRQDREVATVFGPHLSGSTRRFYVKERVFYILLPASRLRDTPSVNLFFQIFEKTVFFSKIGLTTELKRVECTRTNSPPKKKGKEDDQDDYHTAGYYNPDRQWQQPASLPGEQLAPLPGILRALKAAVLTTRFRVH